MNILYIGRFQPFHTGHADAIDQIFEIYPNATLFIGIGSAEDNFTPSNPLTAGERFEIIQAAMKEKKISKEKYHIVPIRNINHYALWPFHVQQYLPQIDLLATGSSIVKNIWSKAFPERSIFPLQKNTDICASTLRNKLKTDTQLIHSSVHLLPSTKTILQSLNFVSRLKDI